jgi:hypothetical protein
MEAQNEQRLYRAIRDNGEVEVTFIDGDSQEDITYTHFEQARADISIREQGEEVYF